jgi:metal-responsive CopG/Arc/MetJ family transcriptional regulator
VVECDEQWDLSEVIMARTHVVMSDEVLAAIDEVAGKRGRSRFLEEAAAEKLARLALEEAIGATAGIARGGAYSHWHNRDSAAAWVRQTRRTESHA